MQYSTFKIVNLKIYKSEYTIKDKHIKTNVYLQVICLTFKSRMSVVYNQDQMVTGHSAVCYLFIYFF